MSPTYATDLLASFQPLWAAQNTRYAIILLVAVGVFALVTRGSGKKQTPTKVVRPEPIRPLPKVGRTFIERHQTPKVERPLVLHGHTFDVYERLIGIASIPGTGKSSILSEMMAQSGGRCICISGGKSPPLIDTVYSMGGRHWETTGTLGIDLLSGDYRRVPQVLEQMFPPGMGDGGLFRSLFRQIARDHFLELEARGDERSFEGIIAALRAAKPDRYPGISPMMIGNWTARMTEVLDSLGPALGTDLNVAEACRVGVPVLFTLDKRRDPSGTLRRMFAAAGMSAAMQAVAEGHAPMVLVDELGLLDADAIAEDARTLREAQVLFAAAAHGKQDFGADLRSLCDFWIFGTLAADEPETRQWASATTFGTKSAEAFGGHALPKGHFIVWDGTRVHDDLIVPRYSRRAWTWSTPQLPARPPRPAPDTTVQTVHPSQIHSLTVDPDTVSETTIGRPSVLVYGPPVMPPHWADDPQLENIWLHTVLPDGLTGCYESTYRVNNSDRPMCTYKSDPEQPTMQWLVYALSLALHDCLAMHMDDEERIGYLRLVRMHMASKILTVEHQCENVRCHRTDHIEWSDRGSNVRLYFERRRQAAAA